MRLSEKITSVVKRVFTIDMSASESASAIVQILFLPFDRLCERLAKRFDYFKAQEIDHSMFGEYELEDGKTKTFTPPNADERENFIPVRLQVFLDRLQERASDGTEESNRQWRDFIALSVARFRYDMLEEMNRLRDAFAPFDHDSDVEYELGFSESEREKRGKVFLAEIDKLLVKSNYFRLPRAVLAKILSMKRPGALPVKAIYDDFSDYRIYVRGVKKTTLETFPRWSVLGRDIRIRSEIISRVCVVAREKLTAENAVAAPLQKRLADAFSSDEELSKSAIEEMTATGREFEPFTIKLFKDVRLEHMNLVAPRVELKFPIFDGVKILGTFGAGAATAIAKMILAAAFTVLAFTITAALCLVALVKSALGFVHRRTSYLQKFARRIYNHLTAANLSAIDSLCAAAEEQEIKEFVLGYWSGLKRGDWATEAEIDADAEAWLQDEFGLEVDFEASDALKKLEEKKALDRRETRDKSGNVVRQYRMKPLDVALTSLDKEWDAFFEYHKTSREETTEMERES